MTPETIRAGRYPSADQTGDRSTLLRSTTRPHPFLSGIHRPAGNERTIHDLTAAGAVTGVVPQALSGRYLRIGPNPVIPPDGAHHWFDGDGMVHGVHIDAGRPTWYRSRWLRSRRVAKALGLEPTPGRRHGTPDTVNTNVFGLAGRTWAAVEAGSYPIELSRDLEDQHYNPFDGTLEGSFSAHPHRDPLTGEYHAITYDALDWGTVRHVVLSPNGRVIREEPISVHDGPSIHDCAITERFVIVLDLPVTFSPERFGAGHRFCYSWNPAHQARVGLLPRSGVGSDIIWCDVEPCYIFHVANAFDRPDGSIVLDAVVHESMFNGAFDGPYSPSTALERWEIDPESRTIVRNVADRAAQEFPRIDERRFGMPYRYAYSIAMPEQPDEQFLGNTRLFKHDLDGGRRFEHDFGPYRHPGEFVFVPNPDGCKEDDGWLVGLVSDIARSRGQFVILDAHDVASSPIATIEVPHWIPSGFHGNWVPDETL